jgi:hypothetical protein
MTILKTSLLILGSALLIKELINYLDSPGRNITTGQFNLTYDYIVIGGGSAGMTVASRLSEDEHVSVLIIESGSHFGDNPNFFVPPHWINLLHTNHDWAYLTQSQ